MTEETTKKKSSKYNLPIWFTYGTLGIILMLLGIGGAIATQSLTPQLICQNTITFPIKRSIHLDTQTGQYILKCGIPILERSAGEDDPFTIFNFNWSELYWQIAANIKEANSREILKAQIPLLALNLPRPIPIKLFPRRIIPLLPPPTETKSIERKFNT